MPRTKKETVPISNAADGKAAALSAVIGMIEKKHGQGAIMKMDENSKLEVEHIPSGSLTLDIALGGGLPKGRIIELYGAESGGKTTMSLHMIAETQKRGGVAGFIDAEHALDPAYARNIGVNMENLYISQPSSGEQALDICEMLVRSGAFDIIVVDSVAALTPQVEIDGEMTDVQVGLLARLMSKAMRKLTAAVSDTGCIIVFINQIREKVGIMFGPTETTPGGRALKFYSSVRLDIRRMESLKSAGENIGNRTKVTVVKNKVAPPFKKAEFDIIFGKGISKTGEIVDLGTEMDIINKSGAWFSYNGEKIGQGRENTKTYLDNNPEIKDEIETKIRGAYGLIDQVEEENQE